MANELDFARIPSQFRWLRHRLSSSDGYILVSFEFEEEVDDGSNQK